jgi:hypothetical protein
VSSFWEAHGTSNCSNALHVDGGAILVAGRSERPNILENPKCLGNRFVRVFFSVVNSAAAPMLEQEPGC